MFKYASLGVSSTIENNSNVNMPYSFPWPRPWPCWNPVQCPKNTCNKWNKSKFNAGFTSFFGTFTATPAVIQEWMKRFTFMGVLNAPFAVDSFFLISAILATYLMLKRFSKQNPSGVTDVLKVAPIIYLHRYIRYLNTNRACQCSKLLSHLFII